MQNSSLADRQKLPNDKTATTTKKLKKPVTRVNRETTEREVTNKHLESRGLEGGGDIGGGGGFFSFFFFF